MQLHQLTRVHKNRSSRQVGRGGKRGKTSGRGTKGQKARSGRKLRPEMRDIIKKFPRMRGRGKNIFTSIQAKPVAINLALLEKIFNVKESVTPVILAEKKLIKVIGGKMPQVKILADGELTKALSISGCAFSVTAKAKIEKAGGTIS